MSPSTRRRFLKDAALGLTSATMLAPARSRAAGAAERVRLAVIGCGNQGKAHFRSLTTLKDAEVVNVCDIDQERLTTGIEMSGGAKPVTDFRRILDDQSIDGVTIATPDHWHAPIAIMALKAGKHVYVEKPCSHNVREAQLLRETASLGPT
jgi:predicted dehydrogenase